MYYIELSHINGTILKGPILQGSSHICMLETTYDTEITITLNMVFLYGYKVRNKIRQLK